LFGKWTDGRIEMRRCAGNSPDAGLAFPKSAVLKSITQFFSKFVSAVLSSGRPELIAVFVKK